METIYPTVLAAYIAAEAMYQHDGIPRVVVANDDGTAVIEERES